MKKILFLITEDTYVRNYIETGVLASLQEEYEIDLAVGNKVSSGAWGLSAFEPRSVQIKPYREYLHDLLNSLLMWRFRQKSETFLLRWLRVANWNTPNHNARTLDKAVFLFRRVIGLILNFRAWRSPVLGNRLLFPAIFFLLRLILNRNDELRGIIQESQPDIVIFPSSAHEGLASEFVIQSEALGIKSLGVIDNWDNLTSKTVMWSKPSFLAVWGPQSKEYAINVQGFEPEHVLEMGTPRFERYFETAIESGREVESEDYILFVGAAMPFDELSALKIAENTLEKMGQSFANTRVLYRPHPWQQKRKSPNEFEWESWKRTSLDPQIATRPVSVERKESFQPELSYYPSLLRKALLVVGPLTSMLLEALLCGRQTIALAYNDGHHFNTSRRYFSHFDILESCSAISFCEDMNDLELVLRETLRNPKKPTPEDRKILSRIVTNSPGTFAERLKATLPQIIGNDAGI